MAGSSGSLHEQGLSPESVDRHRAIVSIMEELEAVDWYDQRVQASSDPELSAILAHNRDEEKEHAAMTLEWLRRHDPALSEKLHTYLFTEGSILGVEEAAAAAEAAGSEAGAKGGEGDGSLGIGSLKISGARKGAGR